MTAQQRLEPIVVGSISLGSPRVRRTSTVRTCGEPNEIKKITHIRVSFCLPFTGVKVGGIFDDETFHAGGDEVDFACWEANAEVRVGSAGSGSAADRPHYN